jgi:hypothetical protein
MRRLARQGFVALIAVLLATSMVAPTVMADHVDAPTDDEDINYNADTAPNIYAHADTVTVATHDRASMDSPLAYYDDDGDQQTLADAGAEMNDSVTAPVGVNLSKVKDVRYRTFPRISSEEGNGATWTDASNWTTSSSTDGSMSVTATTVQGANVSSVEFAATDASTGATEDFGEATYSRVDITSDAAKRVAQVGANVHLDASATQAEIRFVDADGDYVAYYVNTSADPTTNETILTNKTDANAVIAQERAADLTVRGNGDGSFDEIQDVTVRVEGVNAGGTVELFWLDAGAKSTDDLAEVERDTDGDGEDELTYIEDKWRDGVVWTTGLDTLPDWTSDATVFDVQVTDISFPLRNIADHHTNISLTDHPTYDGGQLDGYWTQQVPGRIDLTYTNLTLLAEQTAKTDRYETLEYATDTGSTNLTNVSYTSATSNFDSQGKTVILVSNLNAGEWYSAHVEQAGTQSERDAWENLAAMGGPTGKAGGGFFSSLWGKAAGVVGSIIGALGLGKLFGGGS